MKCYYHHAHDAIGICKNCNRGLCADCLTEIGDGLACRNRCENNVARLNEMINRSSTSYSIARVVYIRSACINLVAGSIFLALAWYMSQAGLTMVAFMLFPLAAIFLMSSFASFRAARGYAQVVEAVESSGDQDENEKQRTRVP